MRSYNKSIEELMKKNKIVKKWRLSSNLMLLYAVYDGPQQLNQDYIKFNSMALSMRNVSDQQSIAIFGKNNKDRYEEMYREFEKIKDKPTIKYSPGDKKTLTDDKIASIDTIIKSMNQYIYGEMSKVISANDFLTPLPMYTLKESYWLVKKYKGSLPVNTSSLSLIHI